MRKIAGYLLTPIHYLLFGLLLLIFHPVQWICLKLGGYSAHKQSVDLLNGLLVATYYVLGNRVRFEKSIALPENQSIIFVSNHQSMYDIPPLIYFLRRYHAKFISKIELSKGIPSISFNLKHGGAANIDRKDRKQSLAELLKLAKNMRTHQWSTVIFPEGTRSKSDTVKPFAAGGIATLIKKVPDAIVVPVAIENSWKMVQYGRFPLNTFIKMSWTILEPINTEDADPAEIVKKAENAIKDKLSV